MQFDLDARKVSLSVREFADFQLYPTSSQPFRGGRWRAELGQAWHKEWHNRARQSHPNIETEASIKGSWQFQNWTFALQGRIDQIIFQADGVIIREIKTISQRLPEQSNALLESYPAYFRQLATYMALASIHSEYRDQSIQGELLFVAIADGISQTVAFENEHQELFHSQLERIHRFLEQRRHSTQRLRQCHFNPPFANLRPGQNEARDQLSTIAHRSKIILLEAPTGFGKTGFTLEYALQQLREGRFDRAIYLTGKSTGQLQVIKQIEAMTEGGSGLQYLQLRNKTEHAIASPLHTCDGGASCLRDIETRWQASNIDPATLFEGGALSLERVQELGQLSGVCPYEISRAALPHASLWISDYNYVFSARNSGVFFNQPGFDPSHTLLIIDEAHNLPSRVASALSHTISAEIMREVIRELQYADAASALILSCKNALRYLEASRPVERLDRDSEYEIAEIVDAIVNAMQHSALPSDALSTFTLNQLWAFYDIKAFFEQYQPSMEKLIWSPARGKIDFTCLSAAPEIAARIQSFAQTILMSATLSPLEMFCQSCGLNPATTIPLCATADWRENAWSIAIDQRVDTRLKTRAKYYALTAETIDWLCGASTDPVAVFFPSYRYAETILEYLKQLNSSLNIAMQPRRVELEAQHQFIEQSLLTAHTLFLVLGSSFAESIDLLGGRISLAMIVGPALPEVNAAQKARMEERSHLPREEAFRQVYQIPALIKINQALGRLVRAPGQSAKALLHCRRFSEKTYRDLLAPDYQNATLINSRETLTDWLS